MHCFTVCTAPAANNDLVLRVELVQQAALPSEDETSAELFDDALTDEEPTDEGPASDDEAFDDLFCDFAENLMDGLLVV